MPTTVAAIRREHIEAWIVAMQDAGQRPASVSVRYRGLQGFWHWLVSEGGIRESPMAPMRPPAVPEEPPKVIREDDLRRLLKVCEGSGFEERRDTAIIRLLMDTGMRRGELVGLRGSVTPSGTVQGDLDFDVGVALVEGKGGRPRACPLCRLRRLVAAYRGFAPAALDRNVVLRSAGGGCGDPTGLPRTAPRTAKPPVRTPIADTSTPGTTAKSSPAAAASTNAPTTPTEVRNSQISMGSANAAAAGARRYIPTAATMHSGRNNAKSRA